MARRDRREKGRKQGSTEIKGVTKSKRREETKAKKEEKERKNEMAKQIKSWKKEEESKPLSNQEWKCGNCGDIKNYLQEKRCGDCKNYVCHICNQKFKDAYNSHTALEAMDNWDDSVDSEDEVEGEREQKYNTRGSELCEELDDEYDANDEAFHCMNCNQHLWNKVLDI
jgi:hypothetical protein